MSGFKIQRPGDRQHVPSQSGFGSSVCFGQYEKRPPVKTFRLVWYVAFDKSIIIEDEPDKSEFGTWWIPQRSALGKCGCDLYNYRIKQMARTFQIVEYKIAETNFFLDKLEETTLDTVHFFEARNYLSAFLASSRSITFSLQASLSGISGFKEWYEKHQEALKHNKLAKYFLEARNSSQKVGYYPLAGGKVYRDNDGKLRAEYFFDYTTKELLDITPQEDVITACRKYFILLLEIVYDCYQHFGTIIDPEQYFSFENIKKTGKTIEDLEVELGYPRGWTNVNDATDEDRFKAIRNEIHYDGIDYVLIKYLGKNRFGDLVE